MSGAALIAWLALSTVPRVEVGDVLEAGLYPASVLLAACEAVDGRRTVSADPELLGYPVRLHVDLEIGEDTLDSMKIALRTSHLYRLDYTDVRNRPIAYVTLDPTVPPRKDRGYEVEIIALEHVSAEAAVTALEQAAERLERDLAEDELPTRFLVAPGGHRLIVRYSSSARLRHYRQLLADLDRPSRSDAPEHLLRIWVPRGRRAQELAEEFERRWARLDEPPVHWVVARTRPALLFQVEASRWPRVRELLEELDPSSRQAKRSL